MRVFLSVPLAAMEVGDYQIDSHRLATVIGFSGMLLGLRNRRPMYDESHNTT
jgi:hypothetical protein